MTKTERFMLKSAAPSFFHIIDAATARCVGFATSVVSAEQKISKLERQANATSFSFLSNLHHSQGQGLI